MNKPYKGARQDSDRENSNNRARSNHKRNTYGSREDNANQDARTTFRRSPRSQERSNDKSNKPSYAPYGQGSKSPKGHNEDNYNEADYKETKHNEASDTKFTESLEQAVLPGIKPVLELLDSDPARIDTVLIRRGRRSSDTDTLMDKCRLNHVRFNLVDAPALDKLYTGAHQGVVARLYAAGYIEVDEMLSKAMDAPLPIIIALDQVQDPGNAGTLARSLYALGGAGLIVPRHNAAYLGASAQRAAAGALEKLPVARVTNLARSLDEAIDAGFTIYGAMLGESSVNAFTTKLHTPCILVLGNEDKGIRPNVAKRCHKLLHIPMLRDFDSLNVAQAGALLLGEFARDLLVEK